jgi:uncharacterized RDD family membrane protein YckC
MDEVARDDDLHDILARLGADVNPNPLDRTDSSTQSFPGVDDKLTDPRDLTRPSSASGIVVDVGAGLEFDPTSASFGQRAVGAIVDTLVVTLAVLPGIVILQLGDSVAFALLAFVVGVLGFIAVVVLAARSLATSGKWIGNRVADTTVVDAINGSFVDQGRAGLRMIGRHLISPIFLFGYLMAFGDGQRRTFHDRLVGTVVIRRPRETWSADDE